MAVLVRSLIVASLCLNLSCSQQETFVSFRTKVTSDDSDNYKQEEDATPIKADKNSTEENELDGNKLNPDSESDDQALHVTPRSFTEASKDYKDYIHFLKDAPSKNGPLLRFDKCKFRPWSTRIKEHTARIISSYPGIKGFGKMILRFYSLIIGIAKEKR